MIVWSKLSSAKWRDAWEERFHALEDTSIVITEFTGKPTIRVEAYCRTRRRAEEIKKEFGGSIRVLKNRDWVAMSAPVIKPIKIRDRFLITPEHRKRELDALLRAHPKRDLITIPARMAFGTGDHATTATVLRFITDLHEAGELPPPFDFLDLGTGSGILAIAAAKLGAASITAVDYDATAIGIARENAIANHTPGIRFSEANVLKWRPPKSPASYQLIAANLFSDVLIRMFPVMKKLLAPGGRLVVSGILDEHRTETLDAACNAGFEIREIRQRGKWVTVLATGSGW